MAFIVVDELRQTDRVANTSESKTALFPTQKGQKPPPIFTVKEMNPYVFFNAFLCDNFSYTNSPKKFSRHTKVPNRHQPVK